MHEGIFVVRIEHTNPAFQDYKREILTGFVDGDDNPTAERVEADTKYIASTFQFTHMDDFVERYGIDESWEIQTATGGSLVAIGEDGRMLGVTSGLTQDCGERIQRADDSGEYRKMVSEDIAHDTLLAAFAFSLIHCENIDVVKSPTRKCPRKIDPGAEQKNKGLVYRVLTLKGKQPDSLQTLFRGMRGKSAAHICRGHIKDYRKSRKGLFGKYKGIWFWHDHIRGDRKAGSVRKQYKVES